MCGTCRKENLKLPLPEIEEALFLQYVEARPSLNGSQSFYWFQRLYNTSYVENPKQIRRAITNLDNLFYEWRNGNLIFKAPVVDQVASESKIEGVVQKGLKNAKK